MTAFSALTPPDRTSTLRPRLPLLAVALTGAIALTGGAQPAVAAEGCEGSDAVPTAQNVAAVRAATLCLVNAERVQRDLGRLKPVAALEETADAYAERMVRERFFEHTSPDGDTFLSRIKRTSYLKGSLRRWSVGENIAWGTGRLATPAQIVKAWMGSAGHRRNILNGRFTELGLGVALGAPKRGLGGASAATYVNEFGERRR